MSSNAALFHSCEALIWYWRNRLAPADVGVNVARIGDQRLKLVAHVVQVTEPAVGFVWPLPSTPSRTYTLVGYSFCLSPPSHESVNE